MRIATRFGIAFLLSLCVLASPPLAADEETVDLMTDDGRLDTSWFGAVAPDFHRCEEERCELDGDEVAYDYLWVRPGFSLEGQTLHLTPWEPGAFRGEAQRDSDEIENGEKITERAADKLLKPLRKAYKKLASVSTEEGDWIVSGRVVDSLGPFGHGFFEYSATTYDLKINDRATGELLLALHTRHVSGEEVVRDFFENAGEFLALLTDAERLYAAGETLETANRRRKTEDVMALLEDFRAYVADRELDNLEEQWGEAMDHQTRVFFEQLFGDHRGAVRAEIGEVSVEPGEKGVEFTAEVRVTAKPTRGRRVEFQEVGSYVWAGRVEEIDGDYVFTRPFP